MTVHQISILWKESISFFSLSNLYLFSLATLNNAHRSFMLGVKYFWWLFLIVLVAHVTSSIWAENVALLLVYFFLILITRPSVERKDSSYFFLYLNKLPGCLVLHFIFSAIWSLLSLSFAASCSPSLLSEIICSSLMFFFNILILCLTMLALLFYVDLKNTLASIWLAGLNSLKFCIYFFPVIIVFILIEMILLSVPQIFNFFITWQVPNSQLLGIFSIFITGLVRLFIVSMVTLYYVKVKYQHIRLFFK